MKVHALDLPEVLLVEPVVHGDVRGFFVETYHVERYRKAGIPWQFVQDNLSYSTHGILRGLHLQVPRAQGKLIQVFHGEVYDVAVDVRVGSPSFGRWVGFRLSGENKRQAFVPPGFAHGFAVVSEAALFAYKCTEVYDPSGELTVRWDDPDLAIDWPIASPRLSEKDASAPTLAEMDPARLPRYTPDA